LNLSVFSLKKAFFLFTLLTFTDTLSYTHDWSYQETSIQYKYVFCAYSTAISITQVDLCEKIEKASGIIFDVVAFLLPHGTEFFLPMRWIRVRKCIYMTEQIVKINIENKKNSFLTYFSLTLSFYRFLHMVLCVKKFVFILREACDVHASVREKKELREGCLIYVCLNICYRM
jgi:hypothetical protein